MSVDRNIYLHLANNLKSIMLLFVKEKLEMILKAEINSFLRLEQKSKPNMRNGYYFRSIDTKFGLLEKLSVPRDRRAEFKTQILEPYQRRDGWLEQAVVKMYVQGIDSFEIEIIMKEMLRSSYSAPAISNIANEVVDDIRSWQQRPLSTCYEVLYLDRLLIRLRRNIAATEIIYVLVGIDEEGAHEIVGFYGGDAQLATDWKDVFSELKNRGTAEIHLGVFDEHLNIVEAFQAVYPQAAAQPNIVNKVQGTLTRFRKRDETKAAGDLNRIYHSSSKANAYQFLESFKRKWSSKYPLEVQSLENDLTAFLAIIDAPVHNRSDIGNANGQKR